MTHILYYSWSGKTRACAENVAQMLQCSITEIKETLPRKKSILGFLKSGYEASRLKTSEIRTLPALEEDQIILAYPIWAGKIPPAVNTALRTLDFKDRRVLVINTMGGKPKSLPAVELARTQIMQRGGLEVTFISVVTGRVPEEVWKSKLQKDLTRLEVVN